MLKLLYICPAQMTEPKCFKKKITQTMLKNLHSSVNYLTNDKI